MKLFVGLDVSSFDIKVCLLNDDSKKLETLTVSNDLPGATFLRDRLLENAKNQTIQALKIGLESTSVYSFHPSMFLRHDEALTRIASTIQKVWPNPSKFFVSLR